MKGHNLTRTIFHMAFMHSFKHAPLHFTQPVHSIASALLLSVQYFTIPLVLYFGPFPIQIENTYTPRVV